MLAFRLPCRVANPPRPACPPDPCQAAKGEVAVAVGKLMEAAGMAEVLTLPKARVPVVKFVVPRTGTKVGVGWVGGWE